MLVYIYIGTSLGIYKTNSRVDVMKIETTIFSKEAESSFKN